MQTQTTDDNAPTLYAHSKRPRWGFAILAWEGREQRRYQFQDGQLRTFKRGYYELLEEVEDPVERAVDIVRDLKAMLRIERGRREPGPTPKALEQMVSFEDQQRIFEALYPKGFEDPTWVSKIRGGSEGRRLKRHRDAAIADAHEKLSKEALDRAIEAGEHRAVVDAAKAVLGATDLTGSKDTAALRHLPSSQEEAFALALRDLLYGEDCFARRFAALVHSLGQAEDHRVSWPLVSAFAALVHPDEHFAIKPSVTRQQARWISPGLVYDAHPTPELYRRMVAMAESVRARLERSGHTPRDLLDVYDFMATTLRPKAKALLAKLGESLDENDEKQKS